MCFYVLAIFAEDTISYIIYIRCQCLPTTYFFITLNFVYSKQRNVVPNVCVKEANKQTMYEGSGLGFVFYRTPSFIN